MSGKIELKVRLGKSLDKKYDWYPEWFIEVTDEADSNKKVTLSPSWIDLQKLIRDIKIHELRVDKTRDRKNDADKWQEIMKKATKEVETILDDFDIPKIYYEPKLKK